MGDERRAPNERCFAALSQLGGAATPNELSEVSPA